MVALSERSRFFLSRAAISWLAVTVAGWALLVWTALALPRWAPAIAWAPFLTVAVLAVVSGLRPVRPFDLPGGEVYLWWAFSFAGLYTWGLWAGLTLTLMGALASQVARRKPWWKALFNTGMYAVCTAAAWCVLLPPGASGLAHGWAPTWPIVAGCALLASWVIFIVLNHLLVALLAEWMGQTWRQALLDDAVRYVTAMLAVLALSPLIAAALLATGWSWLALVSCSSRWSRYRPSRIPPVTTSTSPSTTHSPVCRTGLC
jgi:hypothetical protein